jgi:hypothetical protein
MTENICKWPPARRKTEESGHRMPAEKFLFPQRMVRAYNPPPTCRLSGKCRIMITLETMGHVKE